MTRITSLDTTLETDLPRIVTKLEIISPFIFTKICAIDRGFHVVFELMPLEWMQEVEKSFRLSSGTPMEYRSNLSPGSDHFYIIIDRKGIFQISVYDQTHKENRLLMFTEAEFLEFIKAVYDSVAERFASQGSSKAPIEAHRVQVLITFAAWKDRRRIQGNSGQ